MSPLLTAATELATNPSQDSRRRFHSELKSTTNLNDIQTVGDSFMSDPDIAIPAFERILELDPGNARSSAAIGFVYFLKGEDEQANRQLQDAKMLNPKEPDVILLEAALSRDPKRRAELCREVLQIDPNNEVAASQLLVLEPTLK